MADFLDFSGEEEQKKYGPAPEGSIVFVKLEVRRANADNADPSNPYYSVARSGLKQINCQFEIDRGTYQGCKFFHNITLPVSMQNIQLSPGQTTSCKIGGAQLKAICEASGKPPKAKDITSLSGLVFPIRVGINPKSYIDKKGIERWNNDLNKVITPSMPEFAEVKTQGEIITDGPVCCASTAHQSSQEFGSNNGYASENTAQPSEAVTVNNENIDEVPF